MALPIILTLRIDWSEMDLFGHINNVMYAKYSICQSQFCGKDTIPESIRTEISRLTGE